MVTFLKNIFHTVIFHILGRFLSPYYKSPKELKKMTGSNYTGEPSEYKLNLKVESADP